MAERKAVEPAYPLRAPVFKFENGGSTYSYLHGLINKNRGDSHHNDPRKGTSTPDSTPRSRQVLFDWPIFVLTLLSR
jgi:hypothetical protein